MDHKLLVGFLMLDRSKDRNQTNMGYVFSEVKMGLCKGQHPYLDANKVTEAMMIQDLVRPKGSIIPQKK